MPKFVFMPPQEGLSRNFAARLADTLPEYEVALPETDEDAVKAVEDADAAMGWIPPDALKVAQKVRWLHNPDVGPFYGYYYRELIDHPLVLTNPRGIYSDHIAHLVLTFMLALSRGLQGFEDARRRRVWDQNASRSPYIYLGEATVLINGLGGIGNETARLCNELGMRVVGLDPRPEYAMPYAEVSILVSISIG